MYDPALSPNKVYRKTRPTSSSAPRHHSTSTRRTVTSLDDILREPEDPPARRYDDVYRAPSHRQPSSHTDPFLDTLLRTGSLRQPSHHRASSHSSPPYDSQMRSTATTPHRNSAAPDTSGQIHLNDPKATLKYVRKVERELADLQTQHGDLCALLVRTVGERGCAQQSLDETDARTRMVAVESAERDLLEMWFHSLMSRVYRSDMALKAKDAKDLSTRLLHAEKKNATLVDRLESVRQQQVSHLMDTRSPNTSIGMSQSTGGGAGVDINALCTVVEQAVHRECSVLGVLIRQVHQQLDDVSLQVNTRPPPVAATNTSTDAILDRIGSLLDTHQQPLLSAQRQASASIERQLSDLTTRVHKLSQQVPPSNVPAQTHTGYDALQVEVAALRTMLEQISQTTNDKLQRAIKASSDDLKATLEIVSANVINMSHPAATVNQPTPAASPLPSLVLERIGDVMGAVEAAKSTHTSTHTLSNSKLDRILTLLEKQQSVPATPLVVASSQTPVIHKFNDPSPVLIRSLSRWIEGANTFYTNAMEEKNALFTSSTTKVVSNTLTSIRTSADKAMKDTKEKATALTNQAAQLTSSLTKAPSVSPLSANPTATTTKPTTGTSTKGKTVVMSSSTSSSDFDASDDEEEASGKLKVTAKTSSSATSKKAPEATPSPLPRSKQKSTPLAIDDSLRFDDTMLSLDLSTSAADNSMSIIPPMNKAATTATYKSAGVPALMGASKIKLGNWDDGDESGTSDVSESSEDERHLSKRGHLSMSSRQSSAVKPTRDAFTGKPTPSTTVVPKSTSGSGKKSLPDW